jgi:ureidoacrylate peracid hydrolase
MEKLESELSGKSVLLQAEPEPIEIDLQSIAIMVIDMQNAFVSNGGFFNLMDVDISQSQKIIGPIKKITSAARAKLIKVIYVTYRYSPDLREMGNRSLSNWYKQGVSYQEHPEWEDKFLIRGTWGAEIVKELEPQEGDILVEKLKYSAFFSTDIDVILEALAVKYLAFLGVATNICVEASLRDAYYRSYFPILISDATAPLGPPYMQDATIFNVTQCYGCTNELINILK